MLKLTAKTNKKPVYILNEKESPDVAAILQGNEGDTVVVLRGGPPFSVSEAADDILAQIIPTATKPGDTKAKS
jgi:hypothetical protein